jgi:HlyD family secretion protein
MPGSAPLFRLARDGAIEMRGEVAEQDMPRLKVGQTAMVRLEGVADPFPGRVWQVGAVIDGVTRQGTVRIALPKADQNLRPGAFARADIEADPSFGVILPQTAVLTDDHGTYTLIVGAGDKVERRAINVVGARAEGLLVDKGLTGNERVVAVAGAFLHTGEQVKVAPTAVASGGGDSGKNVVAGNGVNAESAP